MDLFKDAFVDGLVRCAQAGLSPEQVATMPAAELRARLAAQPGAGYFSGQEDRPHAPRQKAPAPTAVRPKID